MYAILTYDSNRMVIQKKEIWNVMEKIIEEGKFSFLCLDKTKKSRMIIKILKSESVILILLMENFKVITLNQNTHKLFKKSGN